MKNTYKILVTITGAVMMLCAGVLYLWSVFQPHVVAYYGWSPSDVSMTSAIMIACFVLGNIGAGLVQALIPPKFVAIFGSVLFSLGLYLSSTLGSGNPYLLYLTYGILGGISCGLIYSVVLAVLHKWFAARMGFITGISVGFFGLSAVIFSPVIEALIVEFNPPGAFRILSIVFFVVLLLCSLTLKNPNKDYYYSEITKSIDIEFVKQFRPREMLGSISYYYIVISTIASSAAYLVIVPFISTIAISRGMSPYHALITVMGTGIASAMGRILAPMLSDKTSRTGMIVSCAIVSGTACLLIIKATGVLYTVAVFLIAMAYGGVGGTNPVITTELFGARYSGANYGLIMLSIIFSSLVFGRLSAAFSNTGDYSLMFVICAILCIVPLVMMSLLRLHCKKIGKKI